MTENLKKKSVEIYTYVRRVLEYYIVLGDFPFIFAYTVVITSSYQILQAFFWVRPLAHRVFYIFVLLF